MPITSFDGKIAFITGGAKGIGLEIARKLVAQGAQVMLADINQDALAAAQAELGDAAATVLCDVADAASVEAAAKATVERFGKVHLLFNNAGVGGAGQPGSTPLEDWRWVVNINLMGVVYGVETFVPLIKSHGEGGYIVNTASMAGIVAAPPTGAPYNATKFAVVGYTETIRAQLAKDDIGCSVLCPAWVATDIHKSGFRAPSSTGMDVDAAMQSPQFQKMAAVVETGLSPDVVADWTLESLLAGRQYVFTHPDFLAAAEARMAGIRADYAACEGDERLIP